jgi:hypothetical protein
MKLLRCECIANTFISCQEKGAVVNFSFSSPSILRLPFGRSAVGVWGGGEGCGLISLLAGSWTQAELNRILLPYLVHWLWTAWLAVEGGVHRRQTRWGFE